MTTSDRRPLCSLCFKTQGRTYEANLSTLLSLIEQTPENAIVLAPEVCLTNFDYDAFARAVDFTAHAHDALRTSSRSRTIVLTMLERKEEGIFNTARVYHDGEIVHTQSKAKLFSLGGERRWFSAGKSERIAVFEVDGIRMGILICFELRFTSLWEQLRGAEIIFVPAQWGRIRATHYDILGRALAIANQCYVVQSDTDNDDTTALSGIVSPFGECARNEKLPLLIQEFQRGEVQKMRRYLDTGVH